MANNDNLKPPFQPGQSGNPNGRPQGSRNRSTVVRELLEVVRKTPELLTALNPELTGDFTTEQIITLAQIEKASNGDTLAYKALMDSAYGAPLQEVQTTKVKTKKRPDWLTPTDSDGEAES